MDKEVEMKSFNLRMTKDIWMFLKRRSADQEISMTDIILNLLDKYKKRIENKLTD